ncbi:protein kinase [Streptosporangium sp. NPDC051023]|uniref:serine/threonine-protein kinase n=1 Tax=Streptosporangium sp. NPDC051023 TaxID=3155410 RepID=UPI00344E1987
MSDSGEIIGARYRLLEHIGRGGMGTVWRAQDEVLGRNVAVKEVIPSPDLTGSEREVFTVRTLREARAAGRIGHPGVATVYDVIEEHGRPWIVMQLVESRTLGAVVREDGPLPPTRVAQIGLEVLGALIAAHNAGVLHRDVKPDNVLLARDGRAVLTDFGIAVLEGDSSVTRTGALIGTPAFIAPERASGGPAEFASDLWSLGVTLYVAVEGRSPFERAHPLATLSAVMHEEPAPLRFAGPLGPVVYGLLSKEPARRMSAQDVQTHLRSIVNGIAPQATMPIDLPALAPVPMPVTGQIAEQTAGFAVAPPGPGGEDIVAAQGARRRRPATATVVAAVLAVTATAGAAAWAAMSSAPPLSREPSTSASVPARDDSPRTKPEQAKLPSKKAPSPVQTGQDRRERPAASPSPRDEPETSDPSPSGEPSATPSKKPQKNDTGDGPGKGKGGEDGKGQDSENGPGSGDDGGNGSPQDQGDDQGAGEQEPLDEVDPGGALNALAKTS